MTWLSKSEKWKGLVLGATIFSTRFEWGFTSSPLVSSVIFTSFPLVSSVVSHLLHPFRV